MALRGTKVEVYWSDPETEDDFIVECYVSGGDPGRTYGPPESCYPPEAPEVEVLSILHDGGERDGLEALPEVVNRLMDDPKEIGQVEDRACEDAADAYRGAYEAAQEARDDERRGR